MYTLLSFKFGTVSLMCSHVKQYVYVIVSVCLWFLLPAYAQIQPQALIKQQPQQFVIQPQAPPTSRTQPQLLQTASVQPHQQAASLAIQSSAQISSVAGIIPVLPKPALHNQGSAQNQQATIFHSTISHHALSQHGSHTGLAHAKAQPVQLTAINLQIQPAQSQVRDSLTRAGL